MKIGTILCKTIIVLTISSLKEAYAAQCTETGLTMCACSGTAINCPNRNLAQVPSNIPANTTELRLNDNRIQIIDATSLSGLTMLLFLDLSHNKLSNIDALSDLQSLRKIFLFDNKLSSFKPDMFTSFGSLIELKLFDNMLTTVSANIFAKVTGIQTLAMDRNPLICCSMTDWFDWAANQTPPNFFTGTCTDFDTSTNIQDFNVSKCSVDGAWGSWTNPTCSVTCGNGIQSRNRTCDSPVPSARGKDCNGSSVDSSDCSLIDGQWGSWSTGPCSVTCGNGIRYRKRSCDSPLASNNGQDCIGSSTVSVNCTLGVCTELCKESEKKLESRKMKARKWKRYHDRNLKRRKDKNNN